MIAAFVCGLVSFPRCSGIDPSRRCCILNTLLPFLLFLFFRILLFVTYNVHTAA